MWIVYKATNKMNGFNYIGCTKRTMYKRISAHYRSSLKKSMHKVHIALREFPEECWNWEIIKRFNNRKEAIKFELASIKEFNSIDQGYNSKSGYGKASEELKAKFRKAKVGHVPWNKGKKNVYSDEHRQLLSKLKIGNNNRIKNMGLKQKES